jgi:hypothetical protein
MLTVAPGWRALVVLLVALPVLSAACSGGGSEREPLTLKQYFAEVQAAYDVASARFDRTNQQLDPGQTESEALQTTRNVLREQVATLRDLASTLEDPVPPAELAGVHDAAVAALQDNVVAMEHDAEAADSASNMAAVGDAVSDDESNEAGTAQREACGALERAGAERGITVDLNC